MTRRPIASFLVLSLALLPLSTALAGGRDPVLSKGMISAVEREAKKKAKDAGAQLAHATLLTIVFRLDEARQFAAAAAKLDPERSEPWLALAKVELRAGRRGVAGSHAQRAARLGSSTAATELLAGLQAAVRIATRKQRAVATESTAHTALELLEALRHRRFHRAAELLEWPLGADNGAGLLAGYAQYLDGVVGLRWIGSEVVADGDATAVRAHLLWEVSPKSADAAALAELPPAYRAALPLSWWYELAEAEPNVRTPALERARRLKWTEVSTVSLTVAEGKVVAVMAADSDLLAQALPAQAVDAPPDPEPAAKPEEEPARPDTRSPKSMDDETFRDRYGKQPPATGDAYRYRQIALGLGIALLMLVGVIWLVRREKRKGRAPNR